MNSDPLQQTERRRQALIFVVTMGLVAMFGDMTYEGARSLTGPYLAILGASAVAVGFAAGFGEFLGYSLRLVTGWMADRSGAYWAFTIGGYAVTVIAVFGMAFADSWPVALGLLWLERVGKALRSPARSVLMSYAANAAGPGKAFGLEEALDQIGAVTGPLIAAVAMALTAGEGATVYRWGFAALAIPGLLTLGTVTAAWWRFQRPEVLEPAGPRPQRLDGGSFRSYTWAAALLAFGFSDWALIAYHAAAGEFRPSLLPLLYAGAMAVDALAALGFGGWFDRSGLRVLAVAAAMSAGFAPLAFGGGGIAMLLVGGALWAVGMGAQDSIFKAAVARLVPREKRGWAYGVFSAVFGLAWWVGSTMMGWLYDASRPAMIAVSVLTQLAAAVMFWNIETRLRTRSGGLV